MAEVSSHAPGAFCWCELSTTDQGKAVEFYRGLFGWDVVDQPLGAGETYSTFKLRGLDAGAAHHLAQEQRSQGVPPHWGLYISVTNADEAVARAKDLGASVLAPPFDVLDAGRMAVLRDPGGAVFHVWEAKRHIGLRVVGEVGAFCWAELQTRDTAAAGRFYTQLFGWTALTGTADSPVPYTEFTVRGAAAPTAGMLAIDPAWGETPPHWFPYFQVARCDASVTRARTLGGQVFMEPTDIEKVGRFAVLSDPQGASFAVVQIANA
jgi:predicted enzyme related to lactoylglutathione lyase